MRGVELMLTRGSGRLLEEMLLGVAGVRRQELMLACGRCGLLEQMLLRRSFGLLLEQGRLVIRLGWLRRFRRFRRCRHGESGGREAEQD